MTEICENCKPEFDKLLKKNQELEKRIEKLEKFLHAYENAHTPPSRLIFRPQKQNNDANKPRGRSEGHEGTTRAYKKPDRTLEKKKKKCDCGKKLKLLYSESMIIEEIPKPQPIIVTEFIINHYECSEHGQIVVKHEDCPESGRFGNNVLAQTSLMRFEQRLPLRKVHEALERFYEIEISPASIMDMTNRVSNALTPEYQELLGKIKKSDKVYADETGIRVDGKKYWIWTFTSDDAVLYVIHKSRGKKVVEEILGKDYQGVVVRDGFKAYDKYGIATQRCWAHILREAKSISDHCKESERFYENLCNLFDNTKIKLLKVKNKPLLKKRSEDALMDIISKHYACKRIKTLAKKIHNGFDDWFTFVIYDVEPTNNIAERSLRELVVIRKIIGGLRSVKSTKTYEIFMSCLATWKQNGADVMTNLLNALRS